MTTSIHTNTNPLGDIIIKHAVQAWWTRRHVQNTQYTCILTENDILNQVRVRETKQLVER